MFHRFFDDAGAPRNAALPSICKRGRTHPAQQGLT